MKPSDTEAPPSPIEDESAVPVQYGARPPCFKSTVQEVLFVLTATMAIGMASMNNGVVSVISALVGRELNMTTAEITWISAATS